MPSQAVEVVQINAGTDGDRARWPHAGLRPENAEMYLSKLATRWMKERGTAIEGRKYILDKLPDGYALYGKNREKDSTHVDRYLYGHPKYRFRSVEEFYDHFQCLMSTGSAQGCNCIGCTGKAKKRPSVLIDNSPRPTPKTGVTKPGATKPDRPAKPNTIANPASVDSESLEGPLSMPAPRAKSSSEPRQPAHRIVDEEGTEDIFEILTAQLKAQAAVDQPIKESSFDWIIDRKHIQAHLKPIKTQPRFLPRTGEVVLFVRALQKDDYIALDTEDRKFKVHNHKAQTPSSVLMWEAGLITQLPEEPVGSSDLLLEQYKEHQTNYSGYRIEPMPAIASDDKPWSKRCAYVALHHIRPFAFYRELHKGVRPKDYHPTVQHTLVAMSSFCLFEKYHFKGTWPSATIFNRGFYIGPELAMVGDVIRLAPGKGRDPTRVTDIMRITSVKMKLIHLDAADNPEYESVEDDQDQDRSYDSCVHIAGHAFTTDPTRAWGTDAVPISPDSGPLPQGIEGYGKWYRLNNPEARWEVPFTSVLGRCYEDQAVSLWLSPKQPSMTDTTLSSFSAIKQHRSLDGRQESPDLSAGLYGIMQARSYSTKNDPRIEKEFEKTWFWADTRIEQLDLHEVHGQTVGDRAREPQAWRRALRVREKGAGHRPKMTKEEEEGYAYAIVRGRPQKSSNSMMAASAVGVHSGEEPDAAMATVHEGVISENDAVPAQHDEDPDEEMYDMLDERTDERDMSIAPEAVAAPRVYSDDDDDNEASAERLLGELTSRPSKSSA